MLLPALLASFLALSAASPAAAVSGAEVIERMHKRLAKSKSFSARFEKRFYWAVLDKRLTQSGRIYTRKPGKFRVEVGEDVVVADGRSIWAYTEQNKQVIVSDYAADLQTPWDILVDYTETFTPVSISETQLSGRTCYAVVLQPRRQGAAGKRGRIERMEVWVDKRRWQLLKIEQLEDSGDLRTYLLADHKIDKKLDDDLFLFEAPSGVDVIDRRTHGTPAP